MSEGAQRRSIDEIIGSIRSIVDRDNARAGHDASNDITDDASLGDLTDLPSSPIHPVAFAEPVAPRFVDGDATDLPPFAHAARVDAADQARLAEIARAVADNIPDEMHDGTAGAAVEVMGEAPVEMDAVPMQAGEVPVHERLRHLHDTVASEHVVAMRGVTVQAANDPAPSAAETIVPPMSLPDAVMGQMAPFVAAAVPAILPQPVPQPAPQPAPAESALSELDEAVLRPIVREWLDDNLPPVVERLVREELQKAIGGKARR